MNVYQLSAKNCMSHLLLKDTFDNFSFIEGEITTFNKFTISGFLQEDFFDEKPEETYSRWNKPETSASRSSAVNALHWDSRLSLRFRKIRSRTF